MVESLGVRISGWLSCDSQSLTTAGDLFDEADFGVAEAGNPDEIVIGPDAQQPPTPLNGPNANRAPHGNNFHSNGRPNPAMVTPSKPGRPMNPGPAARQIPPPALNSRQNPPAPGIGQHANQTRVGPVHQQSVEQARVEPPGQQTSNPQFNKPTTTTAGPPPVKREFGLNNPDLKAQDMLPPGSSPSAGFFSARTADLLRENPHNPSATAFDPHAESPSIRKTAGVDHTKSLPVSKPMLSGASPGPSATRDFINPSQDMTRKIGAPGGSGIGSPMNRPPTTSSFRPLTRPNIGPQTAANAPAPPAAAPPTANRPGFVPPQNQNGKRPPLNDVTNAITSNGSGSASTVGVNDPKRFKAVEASLAQQQQQQHQQQRQQ